MKNLIKSTLLSLTLLIAGCQSNQQVELIQEYPPINQEEGMQTHNQFFSRDLFTLKWNKKKVKVALFLPLSGKHKELGWHLFNSATLSLFENDSNHVIELVLIDSQDSARATRKAFQKIVDQNIKVVIGPVFSSKIDIIKEQANKNNITVISLSNNREIAENFEDNGNIFLAGLMPETEIDKIIGYSMEKGKLNFAVIAPRTKYGSTISTIMRHMVRIRDGNFMTSQFYNANGQGIEKAVERTINSFIIPKELTEQEDIVLSEEDRIYPQVIMIPQSGRNLRKIIAKINELNIQEREFQIIGTSQWDDISTLNNKGLDGAWFAAPNNKKFRNFEKLYHQSYNKFPPRVASIIYDSIIAIAKIANDAGRKNPSSKDFILATKGFDGIDGPFRFLPNGLIQRNLAILEVKNKEFNMVEKPDNGFFNY